MFFYLLAGHALADFPLQGDAMASCKCRNAKHPAAGSVPWYIWLTAHALVHGGTVAVLARFLGVDPNLALWVGVAETVIHWFIDYGKCLKLYGAVVDQVLHVLCKAVWAGVFEYAK
jgi:hypothetical protein